MVNRLLLAFPFEIRDAHDQIVLVQCDVFFARRSVNHHGRSSIPSIGLEVPSVLIYLGEVLGINHEKLGLVFQKNADDLIVWPL